MICSKCGADKPRDQFKPKSHWCLDCHKQYKKEWRIRKGEAGRAQKREHYRENHDEIREKQVWARLMTRYGITQEEYEAKHDEQNGLCAICHKPCKTGQRLVVDHNHETGENRGLLCKSCNLHLGVLEKQLWVERATAYLEEWV
jgi:Recombination endonuclease VII.